MSVRTDSWGGGGASRGNPNGGAEECQPFLAGFLKKRKTHFSLLSTNDIAEDDLTFLRWGCSEAKKEKEVMKKIAKKSGPECRGRRLNSIEQQREYSESRA